MNVTTEAKLAEFVAAQEAVYDQVRRELAAGRKTSHWIWFIFPQVAGLGFSPMSRKFGLASKEEALSYLRHGVLGPRLRECTQMMLARPSQAAETILGDIDAMKFRSCMTLFAMVDPGESVFQTALDRFFGGDVDARTMQFLGESGDGERVP